MRNSLCALLAAAVVPGVLAAATTLLDFESAAERAALPCVTQGAFRTCAFTDWTARSWTNYNGDGSWTCCGPDGTPLPTVRLENFRDGLEDYAYVLELERRLKAHPGAACAAEARRLIEVPDSVMASQTQFTDDPSAVYRWRDRIADLIDAL